MITHPTQAEARSTPSAASAVPVHGGQLLAPADEALFRKLVHDHRQRLYRFVVKHIGWGTDAEDITQQAFVEAANSYSTFKGESELSTWLYGIAMNPCQRECHRCVEPGTVCAVHQGKHGHQARTARGHRDADRDSPGRGCHRIDPLGMAVFHVLVLPGMLTRNDRANVHAKRTLSG